jgi:hypothetical protein
VALRPDPWQDPDLWTCPVNPHLMHIGCNIYLFITQARPEPPAIANTVGPLSLVGTESHETAQIRWVHLADPSGGDTKFATLAGPTPNLGIFCNGCSGGHWLDPLSNTAGSRAKYASLQVPNWTERPSHAPTTSLVVLLR